MVTYNGVPLWCSVTTARRRIQWFKSLPSEQLAQLGADGLRLMIAIKLGRDFGQTVCPDCRGTREQWYRVSRVVQEDTDEGTAVDIQ